MKPLSYTKLIALTFIGVTSPRYNKQQPIYFPEIWKYWHKCCFFFSMRLRKLKKRPKIFSIFSFWVQYLTVLLALDLKTACEDGGVLMWFRRRWLWRQFDTISGHGWNRERTQLTKRSTPHNRLHWITQRREDSSEENCKRELTIGSCRKLTKRTTPNNCFHCNLSRPHCQLAVRTLQWSDVDNTETLQAILTKRSTP